MAGIIQEFKEFAVKGNVIDLAVGVIIGAAFGKLVTSLVGDVLMPPIGLALGGVDFSNLAVVLKPATDGAEAVVIGYGKFIQAIVDFLIVAFVIFMFVKAINKLKRAEVAKPAPPPGPTNEEKLLTEIRDAIKARG